MRPPGPHKVLFLAGTIDNGDSVDWQDEVESLVEGGYPGWMVANPRRKDWDAEATAETIAEQINWELSWIEKADHVLLRFLPESKSPISLLELGLLLESKTPSQLSIFCARNFYRWMNVYITCGRYNVPIITATDIGSIKVSLNEVL